MARGVITDERLLEKLLDEYSDMWYDRVEGQGEEAEKMSPRVERLRKKVLARMGRPGPQTLLPALERRRK